MISNPYSKKEIYGYRTYFSEVGGYIYRLEQYNKSLKFFDQAIEKTTDDKRTFVGRAKARTKVSHYKGALRDIDRALSFDPDNIVNLADKADNSYYNCEFEDGLLQHKRLATRLSNPNKYDVGSMQCTNAIENCVGIRAGRPLRDHFLDVRQLAWRKNYAAQKPYQPVPRNKPKAVKAHQRTVPSRLKQRRSLSGTQVKRLSGEEGDRIVDSLHSLKTDEEPIPKYDKSYYFLPLQRRTTNIDNYMAEKYLGAMYHDKLFLKLLPVNSGSRSPNVEGSNRIQQLAKYCYKDISRKQEILRTRKPFYFIKFQEARVSGYLKERMKLELELQQVNTEKEANRILELMNEAYDNYELKNFLELAEKLKRYCNSKLKKVFPNRDRYILEVFEKTPDAFYQSYRVNPDHEDYEQERRLYGILGLPQSREPSYDSVLEQFKTPFQDYQKKAATFTDILEHSNLIEEICFCYHELARCEFELKHYDLCRVYCRKCIKEASLIDDLKWSFNSNLIMMKSNLAEHNKNDAMSDVERARVCAAKLNDHSKLDFLKKCEKVINEVEFEDTLGMKQVEKRQNRIIKMMASSKMKDEVAFLFKQMAAMPPSRRMAVLPGVVQGAPEKTMKKTRTMSISPKHASSELVNVTSSLKEMIGFQD